MRSFITTVLLGVSQASTVDHYIQSYPAFFVKHVSEPGACEELNKSSSSNRGIKDLYYFDQDACACFYDEDKLPLFYSNQYFSGSKPSPISPGESYLPCQLDEIYNHNLGANCKANIDALPYDYRKGIENYYGFVHEHGEKGANGFDEDGHFGAVPQCEGRVIHIADEKSGVVRGPDFIDSDIEVEEEPMNNDEEVVAAEEEEEGKDWIDGNVTKA